MTTDINSIISNLTINTSIDITNNSYKDWDISLIIKEAVKYIVHKDSMPRDLKRVLCYYGIVDHFYPVGSDELAGQEDDSDIGAVSGLSDSGMLRPPRSVERVLRRGSAAVDEAED